MSQHDYNIANGGGAAVRADINNALLAILSQNSGATAPTTTKPFMYWYDTANSVLKQRNAADSAWLTVMDANGVQFGGQIKFPASQNASSDANTLDDYEEGTFTPTLGGTWTTNPTGLGGTYTKIGRQVHVTVTFDGPAAKASATSGWIASMPFTIVNNSTGSISDNSVQNLGSLLLANSTRMWVPPTSFISGANYFSGTYITNT